MWVIVRACRGIGASLAAEEVERFDVEHSRLLATIAPDEFTVLHQMSIHLYVRKGTIGTV